MVCGAQHVVDLAFLSEGQVVSGVMEFPAGVTHDAAVLFLSTKMDADLSHMSQESSVPVPGSGQCRSGHVKRMLYVRSVLVVVREL